MCIRDRCLIKERDLKMSFKNHAISFAAGAAAVVSTAAGTLAAGIPLGAVTAFGASSAVTIGAFNAPNKFKPISFGAGALAAGGYLATHAPVVAGATALAALIGAGVLL